jgi:hypothetical protein
LLVWFWADGGAARVDGGAHDGKDRPATRAQIANATIQMRIV